MRRGLPFTRVSAISHLRGSFDRGQRMNSRSCSIFEAPAAEGAAPEGEETGGAERNVRAD